MAPVTRKKKTEKGNGNTSEAASSPASGSKRQKNLPVRAKDEDAAITSSATAQAKGTLITFGDDDNTQAPAVSTASLSKRKAAAPVEEIADSDSDDDAAPEAVSTTKAAEDVKKSEQAAQQAAQAQAAALKRKRQERDAFFKQQAEERKKAEPTVKDSEDEDATIGTTKRQAEPLSGRKRQEKLNIPNLLPAEFLTDSSSEDEEDDASTSHVPRSKKRKVSSIENKLTRLDKAPRDERIGATVYRVAKKTDERMAPKLKKHSRNIKEDLLKRNRSAVKSRSGFFAK